MKSDRRELTTTKKVTKSHLRLNWLVWQSAVETLPREPPSGLQEGRLGTCNSKNMSAMNITKSKVRLGNWNVQGLNSQGKIDVLSDECEDYNSAMQSKNAVCAIKHSRYFH